MKTILVPTDLSEHAEQALRFALELAHNAEAKIILYHNMDIPASLFGNELPTATDYTFGAVPITPSSLEITPELEKIHRDKLANLADQIRREFNATIKLETSFNWGSLNANLNQVAQTELVDLVVMGTKGASGFLDRLIGTNTASYIQAAHSLVLVIPEGISFSSFQHIAFASNLAQDNPIYLEQLLAFAKPFGSQITLLNISNEATANTQTEDQLKATYYKNYPEVNFKIVNLPPDNIVSNLEAFVQEQNFDLLAVPIHKEGFFTSIFHSSISEKLALHSIVPLLTLPQKPFKLIS